MNLFSHSASANWLSHWGLSFKPDSHLKSKDIWCEDQSTLNCSYGHILCLVFCTNLPTAVENWIPYFSPIFGVHYFPYGRPLSKRGWFVGHTRIHPHTCIAKRVVALLAIKIFSGQTPLKNRTLRAIHLLVVLIG